jgi:hypothetical protein
MASSFFEGRLNPAARVRVRPDQIRARRPVEAAAAASRTAAAQAAEMNPPATKFLGNRTRIITLLSFSESKVKHLISIKPYSNFIKTVKSGGTSN